MKKAISATIDEELARWLRKKLGEGTKKYRNKSHLIESALEMLRSEEEKDRQAGK